MKSIKKCKNCRYQKKTLDEKPCVNCDSRNNEWQKIIVKKIIVKKIRSEKNMKYTKTRCVKDGSFVMFKNNKLRVNNKKPMGVYLKEDKVVFLNLKTGKIETIKLPERAHIKGNLMVATVKKFKKEV